MSDLDEPCEDELDALLEAAMAEPGSGENKDRLIQHLIQSRERRHDKRSLHSHPRSGYNLHSETGSLGGSKTKLKDSQELAGSRSKLKDSQEHLPSIREGSSHKKGQFFGKDQGHATDQGHSKDQGQGKDQSHGKDQGHGTDQGQGKDQGHSKDQGYGTDQGQSKDESHGNDYHGHSKFEVPRRLSSGPQQVTVRSGEDGQVIVTPKSVSASIPVPGMARQRPSPTRSPSTDCEDTPTNRAGSQAGVHDRTTGAFTVHSEANL